MKIIEPILLLCFLIGCTTLLVWGIYSGRAHANQIRLACDKSCDNYYVVYCVDKKYEFFNPNYVNVTAFCAGPELKNKSFGGYNK